MRSILSSLYPPFPSDYLPAWLLSWFFSSNLLSLFLLFSPFSAFSPPLSAPSFPPYLFLWFVLLFMTPFIRKVSWCSWLSHHLDVVRVPGSNPGETILFCFFSIPILTDCYPIYTHTPWHHYEIPRYTQIYPDIPRHICPHEMPSFFCLTYLLHLSVATLTLFFFFPCIVLAPVAQLVAALDWRSKGHWFEPGREHSFSYPSTSRPPVLPDTSLIFRKVSWCSWLSHHLDVVRVPGSNPGETILFCFFSMPILPDC